MSKATLPTTALALLAGVLLWSTSPGTAPAGAVIGDYPVTLNPATPVAGAAFTASGDDCDGLQYAPEVRNLLTGNTRGGTVDGPTGGHWSVDFASTWNNGLGPGWYTVSTQCDPDGEDWVSDTFVVPAATATLPISIHLGDPAAGENPSFYYATGEGCTKPSVVVEDLTDDAEGFTNDATPAGDGSWSVAIGGYLAPNLHLIGACVDVENQLQLLYEYGGSSTPATTTTTTAAGASTSTTTSTGTTVPSSQAATPVQAQAAYTG